MMPSRVLPKMASSADSTKLRNNAKVCSMSTAGWRPVILVPPPLPRPWGRHHDAEESLKHTACPTGPAKTSRKVSCAHHSGARADGPDHLRMRDDRLGGDRVDLPDRRPPVRVAPGVGVLGLALVPHVEEQPAA